MTLRWLPCVVLFTVSRILDQITGDSKDVWMKNMLQNKECSKRSTKRLLGYISEIVMQHCLLYGLIELSMSFGCTSEFRLMGCISQLVHGMALANRIIALQERFRDLYGQKLFNSLRTVHTLLRWYCTGVMLVLLLIIRRFLKMRFEEV